MPLMPQSRPQLFWTIQNGGASTSVLKKPDVDDLLAPSVKISASCDGIVFECVLSRTSPRVMDKKVPVLTIRFGAPSSPGTGRMYQPARGSFGVKGTTLRQWFEAVLALSGAQHYSPSRAQCLNMAGVTAFLNS